MAQKYWDSPTGCSRRFRNKRGTFAKRSRASYPSEFRKQVTKGRLGVLATVVDWRWHAFAWETWRQPGTAGSPKEEKKGVWCCILLLFLIVLMFTPLPYSWCYYVYMLFWCIFRVYRVYILCIYPNLINIKILKHEIYWFEVSSGFESDEIEKVWSRITLM